MPPENFPAEESAFDSGLLIDEIYKRCRENAPNYGVEAEQFRDSVNASLARFINAQPGETATNEECREFLEQLQCDDLYMAIACSNGNERAWWEFDHQHRAYMERVARHLARTDTDAQDVIDTVYVELYGTRVVDGERSSKFSSYSGRGSIRAWLRTVLWHSLVDLHRSHPDEVSLDELTENRGEGAAYSAMAETVSDGESEMIEMVTRERYQKATVRAIDRAFRSLEPHERLLLLYYHVDDLKLREIATMVENEESPLRGWFQRKTKGGRTHESTVMRWLEKCYGRVMELFAKELRETEKLGEKEMAICLELATEDLAGKNIFANLSAN